MDNFIQSFDRAWRVDAYVASVIAFFDLGVDVSASAGQDTPAAEELFAPQHPTISEDHGGAS